MRRLKNRAGRYFNKSDRSISALTERRYNNRLAVAAVYDRR
jgi:hypothetical protein